MNDENILVVKIPSFLVVEVVTSLITDYGYQSIDISEKEIVGKLLLERGHNIVYMKNHNSFIIVQGNGEISTYGERNKKAIKEIVNEILKNINEKMKSDMNV